MTKRTRDRFDRWSWLGYPLGAVVGGGFLGWFAGTHPPDPDPLTAVSGRGSALLVDVSLVVVAFAGALSAIVFLLGFVGSERGIQSRLTNGLGVAVFVGLIVLVYLGGGVALCSALALLSLWAGMGAGPYLGTVLGATSVAATIGLGAICLRYLGRSAGRFIVNQKREALEGIEEEVCQPQ